MGDSMDFRNEWVNKMEITKETRLESYINTDTRKRRQLILETIGNRGLTARQICLMLGMQDMNYVRPRLTEMYQDGVLEVVGKAYDTQTKRYTAIYTVKEK